MRKVFAGLFLLVAVGFGGYFIVSPALGLLSDQAPLGGNALVTDTLNAPTGLTATGGSSVSLSWTATADTYAAGHRVLRATASGGPYSQIAEVTPRTTATYTDSPPAGTYYYVARAFYQNWESTNSNEATGSPSTITYWYLHNNPTPPTANTAAQLNLPVNQSAPSATSLYNYDSNRDADAGLTIQKGGSGAGETDPVKHQNWRTAALASPLTINGTVSFRFYSGIKGFQAAKAGSVTAYVRRYNGSTYTEICNGTLSLADWQGGSGTWVYKTISFSCPSYTIPAGDRLEIKLIVGASAGDDMWFAYDTASYPSRLDLP